MIFDAREQISGNTIDMYAQTKVALWELSREIYEYAYERYSLPSTWKGDEVVVTSNQVSIAEPGSEQLTIITPATREVLWLFARLREAFADLIIGPSKAQFYARLARAINNHEITLNREHRVNSTLRVAMDEASSILGQMEAGTFEVLPVNQFRPLDSRVGLFTTIR